MGIGVHTAALSFQDRAHIEHLFIEQDLKILCATTTLAQGVNLPAHLVIIKSTQMYQSKATAKKGATAGYVSYNRARMLQMIGRYENHGISFDPTDLFCSWLCRAGRPQYDEVGVAVVLTQAELAAECRQLIRGTIVESQLMDHTIEHLNAEIVSGNVVCSGVPLTCDCSASVDLGARSSM